MSATTAVIAVLVCAVFCLLLIVVVKTCWAARDYMRMKAETESLVWRALNRAHGKTHD